MSTGENKKQSSEHITFTSPPPINLIGKHPASQHQSHRSLSFSQSAVFARDVRPSLYCRPCCCVAKLSLFCLNPFRADTCLMSAPPPSPPLPSLGTYKVLSYHQYLTIDIGHQEIRDGVMIHLVSRDYCFLRRFAFKSNQSV